MTKLMLVILVLLTLGVTAIAQQTSTAVEATGTVVVPMQQVETRSIPWGSKIVTWKDCKGKSHSKTTPGGSKVEIVGVTTTQATGTVHVSVDLSAIQARIAALESTPNRDREQDLELARLKGQLDGLSSRVGTLETGMDNHETRIGALEKPCYAIAVGNKLRNSCTGEKIKTGGGENGLVTWGFRIFHTACDLTGKCVIGGGGNKRTLYGDVTVR
jgi:hypothetical protein